MKNIKKLLSVLICVVMIFSALSITSSITATAATSGTTGECTWSLDGTVLTISGNGVMADYYSSSTIPWGKSITKVIIEDGVTSIGCSAFGNRKSLTSITIGDSVTSIGFAAFYNCTSLTSITIPDSVTSIDDTAFENCTSLTNIIIPNSVTSIGCGAFKNCTSLKSITLPFVGSSRTASGTYDAVFWYIFGYDDLSSTETTHQYYSSYLGYYYYIPSSLKNVTITDATQIPYRAFYNCSNLTSIAIGNGVTSIGDYAFSNCSSLTSITIPDSVTVIDYSAFENCSSLENVFIPKDVVLIEHNAFNNCSGIKNVYYDGSAEEWEKITIEDGNDALSNATLFPKISDNEDEIDILELIYIKNALLSFGDEYPVSYDVNLDGAFNSLDMVALRKKLFKNF